MLRRMTSRAETFAGLHRAGDPLLLPNAWDVASAVTIAGAGARAIATTSAGVAWSLGVPDAADLGADRLAAVIERVVAAVPVPVSADIESGYGDVGATVTAVVQAGAVGINLEDAPGTDGRTLLDPAEAADRIAAARAAADALGVPLWINARTDVHLRGVPGDRLAETRVRAAAYAAAGANSIFVPGLLDLDALSTLSADPVPVAVMVWPGAPAVSALTAAGVVRISLGSAIAEAAYAVAARAATEMLTLGTYDSVKDAIPYGTMNAALTT
jgi:2-methylisocitrate lyase-like PEP mutase family enzyme